MVEFIGRGEIVPRSVTVVVVDNDTTPRVDGDDDEGSEVCSYQIAGDEQLNVSPTQLPFILSATLRRSCDGEVLDGIEGM